jgi:hypothetical protein
MGSIGLREIRGVEAPEASRPDFTGVTVPQPSTSDVKGQGVELALVVEVDGVAHCMLLPPQVPQPVQLLCFFSTLGRCCHPSCCNSRGLFQTGP